MPLGFNKTGKAADDENHNTLSRFDSYNKRGGAGKGKKKQEALDHMNAAKREPSPPLPTRPSMIPPPKIPPPAIRPSMIPPHKIPPPAVRPSMIPPPQTQPPTVSTGWTKNWSDDHNEFYYMNKDGESQWEIPKGYVEE
jgi:hypothetical protein